MTEQTLSGLKSGLYTGATKLKISSGITHFPPEILSLASTLTILDLSGNPSLSTLPSSISQLHNLKVAFFSSCSFTTFPPQLSQCRNLEMVAFKFNGMKNIPENSLPRKLKWLILTGNDVENLPRSIGLCSRLQKCMLAGNRLTTLPDEMRNCRKLGLLRLSENRFEVVPEWLFEMPELAFLSFAGNPVVDIHKPSSSLLTQDSKDKEAIIDEEELHEIQWTDLTISKLLGSGASGIISQATWRKTTTNTTTQIALKLFKGTLTSDGSPLTELHASLLAHKHENLISTHGTITNHPLSTRGLVLELIPQTYLPLGFPPSFQTCTRDVFDPTLNLTPRMALVILLGIASAARHLHGKGIAHGDLYAHNVLFTSEKDGEGHALLGDLGAATVYRQSNNNINNNSNTEIKARLERLEILAFGYLIEDLLGVVERRVGAGDGMVLESDSDGSVLDEKDAGVIEELGALLWRCTDPVVLNRPCFGDVADVLEGL